MPHDTYAAARNAEYTFPSPLYVSLIAACVNSRVCTKRDGIGGINFCKCGIHAAQGANPRLQLHSYSYAYADPRLAAARAVKVAAPP